MSSLADDYSGPFDPDWTLERLSRAGLARLCREYQMVSMFHDRAWMPHIAAVAGTEGTVTMADGEWMGSSPIYTRRNLANVGLRGDPETGEPTGTVETVFKGVQLDIGGPDHYLDFRFEVVSDDEGFFWTEFCGPHDHLRRLSGNDPATVQLMCHDMEDRTFDATFGATNPKARCEPVFRPPRPDEFTGHHCRWRLFIDHDLPDDAAALPANPSLAFMETTRAARFSFPLGPPSSADPGGLDDYTGPLLTWFRLEEFSHPFLVRQAKEYALDVHLLMRAAYWTADRQWGAEFLAAAMPEHRAGFAPGLVERLRAAMHITGDDLEAIGKILQLDPIQVPEYTRFAYRIMHGAHEAQGSPDGHNGNESEFLLVTLADCEALHDDPRSPLGTLTQGSAPAGTPGFAHMAQAVNPRARVEPVDPADLADSARLTPPTAEGQTPVAAWRVWIDPDAEPVAPHPLAGMVNLHEITTFDLSARPATPVEITGTSGGQES